MSMNDPELVGKVNTVNIIVNNIPATTTFGYW